jgi:cobaltochelatase CobN
MHIARVEGRSLDETAPPVDLDQSPADVVFLSFSDSDLASLAAAWEKAPQQAPGLRLANLGLLRHPFSVDLYLEKVCSGARFALVRLLGGMDYWRYGIDQLSVAARASGMALALVPGDRREDARLDAASTLAADDLRRLWRYFEEGGPDNMAACLRFIAHRLGAPGIAPEPRPVAPFGIYQEQRGEASVPAPRALIVFYKSVFLAGDTAPIDALGQALAARGINVSSAYVTSLKDPEVQAPLVGLLASTPFDVILNATAFSARRDGASGVLDAADAPVLQVALAGSSLAQWGDSKRGLGAADLAMHVVLPEIDGRIIARAISFKREAPRNAGLQFARVAHGPEQSRIDYVADLASAWARLRRKPRAARKIACVLSDYPAKGGRVGYAVGLDAPRSVVVLAEALREAGYQIGAAPCEADLIQRLSRGPGAPVVALEDYERALARLPAAFARSVAAAWGESAADPSVREGAFHFPFVEAGNLIIAVQPDRGHAASRKSQYHDANLPPRHAYVAFYLWLRESARIDAMIHCGTHGTLEWLPGKSVALSASCAPEAVLGALPVVYPFIVNNPGEAAQAKRRIGAVTIGHLTPPLIAAGSHGLAAEFESLFDEFAQAQSLDPRRARAIAALILERAAQTGLTEECAASAADPEAALLRLDAWLCDLKDMRIGEGLHVFGHPPEAGSRAAHLAALIEAGDIDESAAAARLDACAGAEIDGLLAALDGRFVAPGPAGAPTRGRADVLPTGRNLFAVDPRAVPTRTAWEIGRRAADEVVARYAQDHGEWPRRIVLDLWGSASMRTGGDDIAQAFALLGVRPTWDHTSGRVNGYEILAPAVLGRSRVDVALRVSGLFRDVFPVQIALLHGAIRDVAALDESAADNPLAASGDFAAGRIFGAPPGQYGVGLARTLAAGGWADRSDLARVYLAATSHAYDGEGEGREAREGFAACVAAADAFVHVQDLAGQDVLDSDAFAEHEGGFAAAAQTLGATPAIYHVDATRPGRTIVRPLAQEVARTLRGRAINPRWLEGQMRHGYRGAAEIAETLDNLFAYAALSEAAPSRHFDLLFDATCGDERVRAFLIAANPQAAAAMAERFEEARRRGFWTSRRNSAAEILERMRGATA